MVLLRLDLPVAFNTLCSPCLLHAFDALKYFGYGICYMNLYLTVGHEILG